MLHLRIGSLSAAMLALSPGPLPLRPPAALEPAPISIATRVLRAHVAFLADDALEGRATGSHGDLVAMKYVAAQFRRLGLEPAGDSGSYLQRVPLLGRTPSPSLRIAGESAALRAPDDYVLVSNADDSVSVARGEVVFAGYGIVAPNRGWDDYAGADVAGKIVMVLPGDPDSTRFDRRTGRPWSSVREKWDEAARRGATALLVADAGPRAIPWEAVQPLMAERIALARQAGAVTLWGWLRDSAAARLAARGGHDLARLAQRAAAPGFRAVPLGVALEAEVRSALRPIETWNVVARLPGRGARRAEALVVGAHHDHIGIGEPENGDSIYNGAEDNASGTAAVLGAAEAIARSGARPERSILFVAFAAEELGLLGSDWFAAHPPPGTRLVGAVALDVQNLYGATRDIGTVGVAQSSLGALLRAAARSEGLRTQEDPDDLRRGRFFRSDNYSFARAGVPSLRIVNGTDFVGRPPGWGAEMRERYWQERYHRPSDQLADWMSFDGLAQQVRVLSRTLLAAADAPAAPTWAAGSDFLPLQEQAKAAAQ